MITLNFWFIVIIGSLLFACGHVLGVYHKTVNPELYTEGGDELFFAQPVGADSTPMPKPSDKRSNGTFPCCDHCYLPDGTISHDPGMEHLVACREFVKVKGAGRGNARKYCQGW